MRKKILLITNCLVIIVLITSINSCKPKCKDCVAIPPATNADAIALQNINHLIDTPTSNAWIARFLANRENICNNKVGSDSNVLPAYERFNKQYLLKILCIKDCIGLKIAYGMDSNFVVHQIISGVSKNNTELLIPDSISNIPVYKLEMGQLPHCDTCSSKSVNN